MKLRPISLVVVVGLFAASALLFGQGQDRATDITQWQDGKRAALAITYDDSTINQFRIALPLMNEPGLAGTFFVITSQIPGSRNLPTFVGRPIMDIVRESATVPTSPANVYERTSMLRYPSVFIPERIMNFSSSARRSRNGRVRNDLGPCASRSNTTSSPSTTNAFSRTRNSRSTISGKYRSSGCVLTSSSDAAGAG